MPHDRDITPSFLYIHRVGFGRAPPFPPATPNYTRSPRLSAEHPFQLRALIVVRRGDVCRPVSIALSPHRRPSFVWGRFLLMPHDDDVGWPLQQQPQQLHLYATERALVVTSSSLSSIPYFTALKPSTAEGRRCVYIPMPDCTAGGTAQTYYCIRSRHYGFAACIRCE